MFKGSIYFVFVVVISVVVDDDKDLEFVNKFYALQIKTKREKKVKNKIL